MLLHSGHPVVILAVLQPIVHDVCLLIGDTPIYSQLMSINSISDMRCGIQLTSDWSIVSELVCDVMSHTRAYLDMRSFIGMVALQCRMAMHQRCLSRCRQVAVLLDPSLHHRSMCIGGVHPIGIHEWFACSGQRFAQAHVEGRM